MPSTPQVAYPSDGINTVKVELPSPTKKVLPGLQWGDAGGLFTPAYWAANCYLFELTSKDSPAPHRLGRSLTEEAIACLLGGYGMPAELGIAAFERIRSMGMLHANVSATDIEKALSLPFAVGNRSVRYRFPRQKARYVSDCLLWLHKRDIPLNTGRQLRDQLLEIAGIGPKTASWIVRNWLDSDDVAILDVHILKALNLLNLASNVKLPKDYMKVESIFIGLANSLGVRASVLDAVMWHHIRRWGYLANKNPKNIKLAASPPHLQQFPQLFQTTSGDD